MNACITTTLALTLLKGIGPAFIGKVEHMRNCADDDVCNTDIGTISNRLVSILEMTGKHALIPDVSIALQKALKIVKECNESSVRIIARGQAAFPKKLLGIRNPPPVIYLRGNEELLSTLIVAIVGSRKATAEALSIANKLSARFQSAGYSICNGIAAGTDTAALQLGTGVHSVVGVLGAGLGDHDLESLPRAYRENAIAIIESKHGLLVSTCPPGTQQTPFSAIDACKYQAALSDAAILIESSETGGSRFTIEAATELSRPIGVVWRSTWDPSMEQRSLNAKLIGQGRTFAEKREAKYSGRSRIVVLSDAESYAELDAAIVTGHELNPMGF